MATQLLSLAGWWFLPNLVTSYAQPTLYRIFIRAGDPHPAPGSPRFMRDRKRIHMSVILLYLLYTIYEAEYQLQVSGNFYHRLGVPLDASEKMLKSRWRKLAAHLHPDKSPSTAEQFTALGFMNDILTNPAKRFAYDRFGPDIATWQACTLTRDYILQGLYQVAVYYIASAGVLVVISWFGYLKSGVFWRYYIMTAMLVLEVASATRPGFLGPLNGINAFVRRTGLRPEYLPYQGVILMRKVAFTFFIAMNQLGPMFEKPEDTVREQGEKGLMQQLDRIDAMASAVDNETVKLLRLEMVPFVKDTETFKKGIRGFLEANTVRNDREVQAAIVEVIRKRREAGDVQGQAG